MKPPTKYRNLWGDQTPTERTPEEIEKNREFFDHLHKASADCDAGLGINITGMNHEDRMQVMFGTEAEQAAIINRLATLKAYALSGEATITCLTGLSPEERDRVLFGAQTPAEPTEFPPASTPSSSRARLPRRRA